MTVLLDFALKEFVASYGQPGPIAEDPVFENAQEETWEEICELRRLLDKLDYLKCLEELETLKGDEKGRNTD